MSAFHPLPEVMHVASLAPLGAAAALGLQVSAFGPFELHAASTADDVKALLGDGCCHALIVHSEAPAVDLAVATELAPDTAVLVVMPHLDAAVAMEWQRRGAQDVLLDSELEGDALALRVRGAIQRKRIERDARTAYATDLDTGLPHQQQFIEHVSQLLALREREPAPMAVLALRIEGFATTAARLGPEAANVLRRKVGVRLRGGVRASDVVASLGDDSFAVLLGSILSPADAVRVGDKLGKALLEPFQVAGQGLSVATALGIAQYPQDGGQPDALLRRAVGLAASTPAQGHAVFAGFGDSEAASISAANDD